MSENEPCVFQRDGRCHKAGSCECGMSANPSYVSSSVASECYAALVNRLRGIYTIPVDDGAGPLNGSDKFTRSFHGLPPIQGKAADAIEQMAEWLYANDCPPELHDLAAKVLNRPSLAHGMHE